MNRIVKELLSIKFPDANIDNLVTIINATPNEVVATEILCGLYEAPDVSTTPDVDSFKPRYRNVQEIHNPTLIKYDAFTDMVDYQYQRCQVIKFFVHKKGFGEKTDPTFEYDEIDNLNKKSFNELRGFTIIKSHWLHDFLREEDIAIDDADNGEHMWKEYTVISEPSKQISTDSIELSKWQAQACLPA